MNKRLTEKYLEAMIDSFDHAPGPLVRESVNTAIAKLSAREQSTGFGTIEAMATYLDSTKSDDERAVHFETFVLVRGVVASVRDCSSD